MKWLKSKLKKQPKFVVVGIVNQEVVDTFEKIQREWDHLQEDQALELWEQMEKAKEEVQNLVWRQKAENNAFQLRHKALWAQLREIYPLPSLDCQSYRIDTHTKQIGYVR